MFFWLVPLLTFIGVLVTRRPAITLFAGTLLGALLIEDLSVLEGIKRFVESYVFGSLSGAWKIGAILFTLILGSFAGLLASGGGFEALARSLVGRSGTLSRRRIEGSAAGLGILCFFDGLANSMLVGSIARPLYEKAGLARARLAFVVDSTSSSIACISFISTWIAMQLSLIGEATGTPDRAYQLFFSSIPHNFYCWFTLITVALFIWKGRAFGPMSRQEAEQPEPGETQQSVQKRSAHLSSALVPLGALIFGIPLLFYIWGSEALLPFSLDKLAASFGGNAGPYALTSGATLACLSAWWMTPKEGRKDAGEAALRGASSMLSPLLILLAAWSFGKMIADLGTARWLADSLTGLLPRSVFPLAIFLVAALVSLATGSSWGTMGLIMPIALGTWLDWAPEEFDALPALIAAVFSGAVFGDHCSPFSDTTIVSSFASGVSTDVHVQTQAPYALVTAGVTATAGFGLAAVGLPAPVCLLVGAATLFGIFHVLPRCSTQP